MTDVSRALIVVDMQNDFMPGGPLEVPEGDELVPVINELMHDFNCVVATQDWHPESHVSFAPNHSRSVGDAIEVGGIEQIMWPEHCVQGTDGASFVDGLDTDRFEAVFRKGTDPMIDSYSGFYDNGHRKTTGLAGYLREKGVEEVYICGVATDYCVKFTALDAAKEGFSTHLLSNAVAGVDLQDGDVEGAIEAMVDASVEILNGR